MNLTSQEKLVLNTQILQFVAIGLNNQIQSFQNLAENGAHVEDRLDDMINLFNEVNSELNELIEDLLNTMDGWDAFSELDLSIINPMLEALKK